MNEEGSSHSRTGGPPTGENPEYHRSGMERSLTRNWMLLAVALGSISLPARGEPAGRLSYERGPGAEQCPEEAALRRAVAARLGEDPFDPRLSRTFRLAIVSDGARLRGSVVLEANGVAEGRRELDAPQEACAELLEAMALAVSLTINPDLAVAEAPALQKEPNARTEPEIVKTREATHAPVNPSPRRDETRSRPRRDPRGTGPVYAIGAVAHGAVGTGPGVAAGGSALLRTGTPRAHLNLEGRVDALSRAGVGRQGTVHSTLLAAVLAPCARLAPLSGCPLLLLGSLSARSRGVRVERSDSGFFAAAGGRVAASAPLGGALFLEARADVLYALTPVTIELDQTPVWRAGASGALGVGLIWEFP
jgi:hypothetical protein